MKIFATLPALALAVVLSGSALADNGVVSDATLSDMGLAGIQVMSDSEGLAVRGMGFDAHLPELPDYVKPKGKKKPWSMAFGMSYAAINKDGAESATADGFYAKGHYMASGEHFSEAGITETKVHILEVKGSPATKETTTKSLRIFSGGFATSSSL